MPTHPAARRGPALLATSRFLTTRLLTPRFVTSAFATSMCAASLFTLSMCAAPAARAANAPAAGVRHVLALPSGALAYRAIWSETVLKDAAGAEQATISTIAYLREDVAAPARRPVIFAFNGGPGASSSPLHTGLLGPILQGKPDAGGKRASSPNMASLLDIADIVLIDPVGTGFSRELRPGGNRAYWNVEGDAKAAELAIRDWLRVHDRARSPVYVIGESYGGYRLAVMSAHLGDLPVAGLVMFSPGLDMTGPGGHGNDLPFIFDLPTMAATAFVHGKLAAPGRTVQQVFEEARAFAQGEYAAALQRGSELPQDERERLARRLAELTGLSPALFLAHDLRLPSQDFLEQLVPGQIVGRVDTRVTAPKPDQALVAGRSKAADDPALGMGKSNVIKSAALRDYLKDAAGYARPDDYVSLSLDVNFAWDWRAATPNYEDNLGRQATRPLQAFMAGRPQARLLLVGGYYDLATPWLGQRYALTHAGVPADRIEMAVFPAGHAMYDDASRPAVAALLRRFITDRNDTP